MAGDVGACESACSKGVAGEGGCFHAGEEHRKSAALDFAGAEWRRAAEYFGKSCDGRYADGCLLAAQMVEAPYGPIDPRAPADAMPKTISDEELGRREKLLQRSCDAGSSPGCKRLGDVLIGKNTDRARAAYEKSCRPSAQPEECRAARGRETEVLERWRAACTRGVADDCTRLGDFLYAVDAPRAVRIFIGECQLRGVEQLAGGLARFVHERAESTSGGLKAFADADAPPPPAAQGPSRLVLGTPSVEGQLSVVEVDRALRRREASLAACAGALPPASSAEVVARLTVDRTGDVWRAAVPSSGFGGGAAACLSGVLGGVTFSEPSSGSAVVDVPIAIRAAGAPPAPSAR